MATLLILFLPPICAIVCYNGQIDLWVSNQNSNATCTSAKYCGVFQSEVNIYQTCYDDPNSPELGCFVSIADSVACYCNTDKCNTIDKVNQPGLPYLEAIECVTMTFGDKPVSCVSNLCSYQYSESMGLKRACDSSIYGFSGFDMPLPFYKDYDEISFYGNACYNFTFTVNDSLIYCRCKQPYPITNGNVECAMGGTYADSSKDNDSYTIADTCLGTFCYIKETVIPLPLIPDVHTNDEYRVYEKGCISAIEMGKFKLQVASFHHGSSVWHVCNTAFCNRNLTTTQRAIAAHGDPQLASPQVETTTQSSPKIGQALFWTTILSVIECTRALR